MPTRKNISPDQFTFEFETTKKTEVPETPVKIKTAEKKVKDPVEKKVKETVRNIYKREDILPLATEYFGGDTLAANVWINKYALKDSAGNIYERTPNDMHWRMARELARIEEKYPNPVSGEEIYKLLKGFKFIIPQGGPMSGMGNDFQYASLSNCFVIGSDSESDSYGAIMLADEEQVQLMKRRGGVGHDLSHIRPKGSPVMNSALTSTGVVPFMERFSNTTREVAQDGRRGALMLSISIDHPDAEDFIDAKTVKNKVTGANVSVRISDQFMEAVTNKKQFKQSFPIGSKNPIFKNEVDAAELWNKIIHNAWASAEPGVLFWDTIHKESIPDCYSDFGFKTVSTNPCGEIPLCPYDSCRLLAINLYSYVENPFSEEAGFNFEKFRQHVRIAQRMMDDIVDLEIEKIDAILKKIENDPEPKEIKLKEKNLWNKIREKCIQGRRTGLGITAEGDMLAALNLRYGSDDGIDFSEKVQKALALAAYGSSVEMAEDRGQFPIYNHELEMDNPFISRIREADPELYARMEKNGRRNVAILTIAPTGTTSLMTQTTSGIEPAFSVSYKRRKKVNPTDKDVNISFVDEVGDSWEEYFVLHPKFGLWLETKGIKSEEIHALSEEELNKYIEISPYYKATAADIDWIKKVEMQGRLQKWVDHSISVTVNVPKETPEDIVNQIYLKGWESGCKGMTVYREGSRDGVLISANEKSKKDGQFSETTAPKRPKELEAKIVRFNNNDEKWIGVVGILNDRPYEIFTGQVEDRFLIPSHVTKGIVIKSKIEDSKSRYDFRYKDRDGFNVTIEGLSRSFNPEFWNYAKLISGILRHGMPLKYVIDIVSNLNLNEESLNTWKSGIIRALSKLIPDGEKPLDNVCNSCKSPSLVYEEGCLNCKNCGYSQCG